MELSCRGSVLCSPWMRCKAIVDMVEEITRLKHLIVTVVFKDDAAGRKMEELQARVDMRRQETEQTGLESDCSGWGWPKSS